MDLGNSLWCNTKKSWLKQWEGIPISSGHPGITQCPEVQSCCHPGCLQQVTSTLCISSPTCKSGMRKWMGGERGKEGRKTGWSGGFFSFTMLLRIQFEVWRVYFYYHYKIQFECPIQNDHFCSYQYWIRRLISLTMHEPLNWHSISFLSLVARVSQCWQGDFWWHCTKISSVRFGLHWWYVGQCLWKHWPDFKIFVIQCPVYSVHWMFFDMCNGSLISYSKEYVDKSWWIGGVAHRRWEACGVPLTKVLALWRPCFLLNNEAVK